MERHNNVFPLVTWCSWLGDSKGILHLAYKNFAAAYLNVPFWRLFGISCIIVCCFYSCLWHVSGIALCLLFSNVVKLL